MSERNREFRPKTPGRPTQGPRRHEERALMKKKTKYREDPLLDEDLLDEDDGEDGGVLSDYDEEPEDDDTGRTGAR